jgi:hypothetical protein
MSKHEAPGKLELVSLWHFVIKSAKIGSVHVHFQRPWCLVLYFQLKLCYYVYIIIERNPSLWLNDSVERALMVALLMM